MWFLVIKFYFAKIGTNELRLGDICHSISLFYDSLCLLDEAFCLIVIDALTFINGFSSHYFDSFYIFVLHLTKP